MHWMPGLRIFPRLVQLVALLYCIVQCLACVISLFLMCVYPLAPLVFCLSQAPAVFLQQFDRPPLTINPRRRAAEVRHALGVANLC